MLREKGLRSGYTTGACAAAAAKAATLQLFSSEFGVRSSKTITDVEITFPDGSRHTFKIHNSELLTQNSQLVSMTSVIKDAGDDPDVTNGAEIRAEVVMRNALCVMRNNKNVYINSSRITDHGSLIIKGGQGVGIVTKPGLPVPVGEPAINPVPRRMIKEAVMEAITEGSWGMGHGVKKRVQAKKLAPSLESSNPGILESSYSLAPCPLPLIEVTISVPDGKNLAKKTLNSRLGIIGGISILGTTGIVKPVSSEAWTATIISSMDVARAMGHDEIVLSAGRASEKAHMKKFNLPEESYVIMGDYLEFSLLEAKRHEFKKIHLCTQWAKMLKIAMSTPQTHVRHGALDTKKAVEFLKELGQGSKVMGQEMWNMAYEFNTAREIFDFINSSLVTLSLSKSHSSLFLKVCSAAKRYAEGIAGMPVITHLISYEGEIIVSSE